MSRRRNPLLRMTAFVVCIGLIFTLAGIWNQTVAQTPAPNSPLSPQELRGRTIYQLGQSTSGKEIVALVSGSSLPATSMTCANCHGARGQGLNEGGVTAGSLTWSHLTNIAGHLHANGRKHKPFNELLVARATTDCVDPDGHKLLAAMPCYRMSAQDLADLVAYLKRIEGDVAPGVTETAITIGAIVPNEGPLAEMGAAMRTLLTGYFEELNLQGGVFGRKVSLRFANMGNDPATTMANVRSLTQSGQVFALVGGISAGIDKEIVALAQSQQLPVIGLNTLLPQSTSNDYVFYLYPGTEEQARALVNFAAQKPALKKSKLALVVSSQDLSKAAATAVEDQAKILDWPSVRNEYTQNTFNAVQLVEGLKASGSDALFFFGSKDETLAIMKEAAVAHWTPNIFILSSLVGNIAETTTTAFQGKVFLSFPTVPSDLSAPSVSEFRDLREKYKLPARNVAAQLSTLAAAKVFVEALKLAGKDLTRSKLVTALEGLSNFETGLSHSISFGPKQRIGARGSYIVGIDAEKKEFSSSLGWVKSN